MRLNGQGVFFYLGWENENKEKKQIEPFLFNEERYI